MKKKIFLIISFLLVALFTFSQSIIRGFCKDSIGMPIPFATIVASDSSHYNNTIGFVFTDSIGFYEITINIPSDSIYFSVSHIDYEIQKFVVKNTSQIIDFILLTEVKSKVLQEVFVYTPPIITRGDTLHYSAERFKTERDRTLEDILKKMPGVEVDANGRIKYQGRYINKFYVEGRDLLEGNYQLISKSLPIDDVQTVQMITNHQPLSILKDKIFSPNAAVNIKLKKTVSFTGRGKLGIGALPLLRDISLSPMLFSKNQQMLLQISSNNIGQNLYSVQSSEINLTAFEGNLTYNSAERLLKVAEISTPSLSEKRYLINNDNALSVNYLFAFNKNWEAKINTTLLSIKAVKEGNNINNIYSPDLSPIIFKRSSKFNDHTKLLNSSFTLVNNSDNLFLRNTFSYTTETQKINGTLLLNDHSILQNNISPYYSLQNSFSTIFPLFKNKRYLLNIISSVNSTQEDQRYMVSPTNSLQFQNPQLQQQETLHQTVNIKKTTIGNSASLTFTSGRFSFTPHLKQEYSNVGFTSRLLDKEKIEISPFEWNNEMESLTNRFTTSFRLDYNSPKFKISTSWPLAHYKSSLNQQFQHLKQTKTLFEPLISIWFKLKNFYDIRLEGERKLYFPTIGSLHNNYLLSALDAYKNDASILPNIVNNFTPSIEYKNPIINLFANLRYSFTSYLNYQLLNVDILSNGQTTYQNSNYKNRRSMQGLSLSISKLFPDKFTRINLLANHFKNKSNIVFEQNFVEAKTTTNSFLLDINSSFSKYFNIELKNLLSFSQSKSNTFLGSNKLFSQSLTFYIIPVKNHMLTAVYDFQWRELDTKINRFSCHMFDIAYQFTMPKKKLDWELKLNNILNQKEIVETGNSYFSFYSNFYALRPRQFLIAVKMNL